ncbi:PGF-CTERM-anchored ABC transporter substrate-binding protein [Halosolutus amylolyticus]|uniref:PGF-CTERM-anchored ABC transporter substrate-binding protein n=1 Tax=Halosolutus amylolyticus TaxID=2932267 RepID=A0ABD5PMZ8_9EURY|nr:PGF-CTERM-anchored ABC transporter substrate-binding protein [Halosolutus amylolyticus]
MRQKLVILITAVLTLSLLAPAVAGSDAGGAAAAAQAECEYPIELTDATGERITLEEPPESVVALQASDAQTMYEIGAEDRLDGLPYSPATSGLDRGDRADVGNGWQVNTERVIDLDPDVVLAANITDEEDIETLRDAGLTVYHFEAANTIDDVRDNVVRTGELTDECAGATETADWMDEQLEVVETAVEDADRPLAYYAMGEDGTTAGTESFIHEALTTAGVEDLAERAGITFYQQLSSETIVDEDPEWIIYPDDRDEPPIPEAAEATTAYQNDNVVAVDANQISQPAPQVVYAIVDIVEAIHPDAYEAASDDLEESGEDSENDGDAETGSSETDGDDTSESIPGFGAPVAVAALLGGAFVLRRR